MPASDLTTRDDVAEAAALVALADEAEEHGDHRRALDALTAANVLAPNDHNEERLIGLRHRAFAQLDRDGGRPTWPPEYADPFPDVHGRPPEVEPEDLTADVLGGAIVNHGCLLVRELVREPWLSRLIEDIDRAFAAVDARTDEQAPLEANTPWFVPFKPDPPYSLGFGRKFVLDGGGVWTVDSPRSFFDLHQALEVVGLVDVIAEYMGERPAVSAKKSTLRRVPVDSGTDWHQDGSFMGEGIRTVNLWLALTPCGKEAPSLDIVPQRIPRVLETGTRGATFDWSVGPGTVEEVAADCPVLRPDFEAGDALLFDEVFLHRTGVGPHMTTPRYAIESWFFAPSAYPEAQVPIAY